MTVLLVTLMMLLMAGCGDGDGNNDTILGGFSGVLIFGIIVWVIYRHMTKRGER